MPDAHLLFRPLSTQERNFPPNIFKLGSEKQNIVLACKPLPILLLQNGKCLKSPNEGILFYSLETTIKR